MEVSDTFPSGVSVPVPVRDSETPDGPAVVFPAPSWSAFVTALRSPLPLTLGPPQPRRGSLYSSAPDHLNGNPPGQ
ncbi:DUF397 domain-containing protein [Embleya scabrispora]|uniref:DUF397 domain-containing protein n=1 Tax=Embleya scabrispora TaxID=159449 RepID=UPI002AA2AB2E|nr:DUF397 domain-containing protein [Embleya scabrispora]